MVSCGSIRVKKPILLDLPGLLSYFLRVMANCYFCKKPLGLEGKVSFRELCVHCGMDVHVCCNCNHYDPGRSNYCREPMAEKVRDIEARNTCEYFILSGQSVNTDNEADKAKAALEDLFKKK